MCSALIKAGSNKNQIQAVLEYTAFVAIWAPGSKGIYSNRNIMVLV